MMISNRVNRNEEIEFIQKKNYLGILPLDILKAIFLNLKYKDSRQINLTSRIISKACKETALDKFFSVKNSLLWLTKRVNFNIEIKNHLLKLSNIANIHSLSHQIIFSSTIISLQSTTNALKMLDSKSLNDLKIEAAKDGAFHLNKEVFDLAKIYRRLNKSNSTKNKQCLFTMLRAHEYYMKTYTEAAGLPHEIRERLLSPWVEDLARIGKLKTAFKMTSQIKDFNFFYSALTSICRHVVKFDYLKEAYFIVDDIQPHCYILTYIRNNMAYIKENIEKIITHLTAKAALISCDPIVTIATIRKLKTESEQEFAFSQVCNEFLENNDIINALVIAEAMPPSYKQDFLLKKICIALIDINHPDFALIVANKINYFKDAPLKLVSASYIKIDKIDMALKVANSIEVIPSFNIEPNNYYKTEALESIIEAYIQLKDKNRAYKIAITLPKISNRDLLLQKIKHMKSNSKSRT